MKLLAATTLATAAIAVPVADPAKLEARQSGHCFVWARGSMEPAPLGMLVGPQLERALKAKLPGMKTYPVGYAASISTNISIQRTDAASIAKGVEAFKQASGCTTILAGGYSQGAAVMHNVIPKLEGSIKSKIVGVALFGDTRNQQDKGHIPNFPTEKSKVWCNQNDGVCGGGLNVNAGHMTYGSASIVNEAASWLVGRTKAGGSGESKQSKKGSKDKEKDQE